MKTKIVFKSYKYITLIYLTQSLISIEREMKEIKWNEVGFTLYIMF